MRTERGGVQLLAKDLQIFAFANKQRFERPYFVKSLVIPIADAGPSELSSLPVEKHPTFEIQAEVVSELCFLGEEFKKIEDREELHDPAMRTLMIESSRQIKDWLVMRAMLNRKEYSLLVHFWASRLSKLPVSVLPEEEIPDFELPLYLKKIKTILDTELPEVDKGFKSMITTTLRLGVDSKKDDPTSEPTSSKIANVITSYSFRNTDTLEGIHSGIYPLNQKTISNLRYETRRNLKNWLIFIDKIRNPQLFNLVINAYNQQNCSNWEK